MYWVRPKLSAFVSWGAGVAVVVSLLAFAAAVSNTLSVYQQQLTPPSGAYVPIPALGLPLFVLAFASALVAPLAWRRISQLARIGNALLLAVLYPAAFFLVDVASTPSNNIGGPPPPFGNASSGASALVAALATPLWNSYAATSVLVVVLGLVVPTVCAYVTWRRTFYGASARRIVTVTGMVGRYTRDAELNRIEDVTVDQGVLGRWLGYGDVIVATGSDSRGLFGLRGGRHGLGVAWLGVPEPTEVRRRIYELLRRGRAN